MNEPLWTTEPDTLSNVTSSTGRLCRAGRGSRQSMLVTVLALGWSKLWHGAIAFDDDTALFVCSRMRGGFGRAGTTVGGAYLTDDHTSARILRHESVHADQWARYGIVFAAMYLFEEVRHPQARNRFEIEAGLTDGGYR